MGAPKRELFKAADVCVMAQLQPYVLRSWEAEFPQLGQTPAGGGARVFRRSDVEFVLRIKQLVFGEGLTLAGARRRLDEESQAPTSVAAIAVHDALGDLARSRLRQIRRGLEEILALVSRGGSRSVPPELELVPPGEAPRRSRPATQPAQRAVKRSPSRPAKGHRGKRRRASA
jgi:DNA-binding transcriptional MerR regulator